MTGLDLSRPALGVSALHHMRCQRTSTSSCALLPGCMAG
eukprot:CAMPEP_0202867736 /NCGR_PEP_ID=MMETSP1391-20130828/9597_1 /ASSEMBLY_ACC=CAM_ASM_000867 /TAXON_ID=1034604 /ORGANISM="Chlamydomonas leiostraca, Strain SAG 11-49" /LENGTH=38 /DNA_ID= /DNA_START= /DNA_END= /DNA_ORIENTATION=